MTIVRLDNEGLSFILSEEGLKLKPYRDSKGVPTIGVGCTYYEDGRAVQMSDPPITKERTMALFRNVVVKYEATVTKLVKLPINQRQFNALVSLCYNIGVAGFTGSTVLRLVNTPGAKQADIETAFKAWRYSGREPALLKRRMREAALYFS